MEFRGNRWYKSDLHIHTPESICFEDKNVTPEMWVQTCIDRGLDVVAVTDHNSGNYIDKIMRAAENTTLTVFPGVEITCDTSKIHLLIIFDRDKSSSDINDFLVYCGIQKKDFANQNATTANNETIFNIADKALNRGAIVIPAHIDEYNAISKASYQTTKDFLTLPGITSAQVVNKEIFEGLLPKEEILDLLMQRYPKLNSDLLKNWSNAVKIAKDSKKAILTFSDNPKGPGESKHGLWGIGKRYTWIKMDEDINIESLRQALLMPDKKIRNDFMCNSIPYKKPDLLIKGLKINDTMINSESNIKIQFSPQLNTIIGGRGTGKSSVQRIIRGLLSADSDLKDFESLYKEQSDFFQLSKATSSGEDIGVLTKDSKIELFIERYEQSYKISFNNFNNNKFEKTIYKLNELSEYIETNEQILTLFPVEIYSQKQIYNIAMKPNALREKIDQSIFSFDEYKIQQDKFKSDYLRVNSGIKDLKNFIEKKPQLQIEKKDKQDRLKLYKENGYNDLINLKKDLEKDKSILDKIIANIEEKANLFEVYLNDLKYDDYKRYEFSESSTNELNAILSDNYIKFDTVVTSLKEVSKKLDDTKNSLIKNIDESDWKNRLERTNKKYKLLQEKLSSDQLNELNNIEELSQQLVLIDNELEEIKEKEEKIKVNKDKLNDILKQYLYQRKEFTNHRNDFLNTVLLNSPNIKIEVKPFRDRIHFENEFRRIIQRPDSYVDDINKVISFVFNGLVETKIENIRKILHEIRKDSKPDSMFSMNFNKLIIGLNDEQMSEINLLYPEDKIEVKYKANEASNFKSISNASAGQKTSAILTFLLSYGKEPLLLDQPEDDLDNQLIYDLIVERLSESKNQRQIIVISHNANIPVNGDAEWVTALDSESKGTKVLCEGSIGDSTINEAICNIMEGGEEAFSLRAKRYNFE